MKHLTSVIWQPSMVKTEAVDIFWLSADVFNSWVESGGVTGIGWSTKCRDGHVCQNHKTHLRIIRMRKLDVHSVINKWQRFCMLSRPRTDAVLVWYSTVWYGMVWRAPWERHDIYQASDGKALLESRTEILPSAAQSLKEEQQGGRQLQNVFYICCRFLKTATILNDLFTCRQSERSSKMTNKVFHCEQCSNTLRGKHFYNLPLDIKWVG